MLKQPNNLHIRIILPIFLLLATSTILAGPASDAGQGSPERARTQPGTPEDSNTPRPPGRPVNAREPVPAGSETGTASGSTGAGNTGNASSAVAAPKNDKAKPESADLFLNHYKHRLRILIGPGFQKVSPAILSESKDAWPVNSILRSAASSGTPISIPVLSPAPIKMYAMQTGISYSYRDRFDAIYRHSEINQKFSRSSPTSVNFFNPATDLYYWSVFEGTRLLQYKEQHNSLDFDYTFPVRDKLKVGPLLGIERYSESNLISFGSYMVRRNSASNPLLTTWSIGGDVYGNYSLRGYSPGFIVKYRPRDWIQLLFSLQMVSLKGNFDLSGGQLLKQTDAGGGESYQWTAQYYTGNLKDSGVRARTELVLRFCRFSIHAGLLLEKMDRTYGSYAGDSVSTTVDYSYKTGGPVGFGEMAKGHPISRAEFYLLLGTAFFD